MPPRDLTTRLRPFLDAGLMTHVPTPFQIRQGELVMFPYVISSEATDESRLRDKNSIEKRLIPDCLVLSFAAPLCTRSSIG